MNNGFYNFVYGNSFKHTYFNLVYLNMYRGETLYMILGEFYIRRSSYAKSLQMFYTRPI